MKKFITLTILSINCFLIHSLCPSSIGPITIAGNSIHDRAYEGCGTITEVTIPSEVYYIEGKVFILPTILLKLALLVKLTD